MLKKSLVLELYLKYMRKNISSAIGALFFTLYIGQPGTLFAQTNFPDSSQLQKVYNSSSSQKEELYMGRQYMGHASNIKGSAYFLSSLMNKGDLCYEGVWHHDIPLLFDMHTDDLITVNEEGARFVLNKTKINAFIIEGHEFEKIEKDGKEETSGFYKRLTKAGKAVAYVKIDKVLKKEVDNAGVEKIFEENIKYYINVGGKMWYVKKEKDILSVLKDKQSLLLEYKKANNLSFRNNPQDFIIQSVNYYNKLSS